MAAALFIPSQFHNPKGVAILPSGTIVVCDANNDRLVLVKEDGTFLRTIGNGKGSAPNQFQVPFGVTVLPSGTIVVCDCLNHRLQFVKEDGTFVKSIGNGQGSGPNQFDRPMFIARLPNGILVVSNCGSDRLQFLQEDGTFLGSHDGDFKGIVVLPNGSLVATERKSFYDNVCIFFLTKS